MKYKIDTVLEKTDLKLLHGLDTSLFSNKSIHVIFTITLFQHLIFIIVHDEVVVGTWGFQRKH